MLKDGPGSVTIDDTDTERDAYSIAIDMITSAIIYFRKFESRGKHSYGDDSSFALLKRNCAVYTVSASILCVASII